MKLIVFFSLLFSLVAVMLLVVSYPHFPRSSSPSVEEAGAFATNGDDTTVTFSFITALLNQLRGGNGGGSLEPTKANPQAPPAPPRSGPFSVPDFSTCRPGNFPNRIIPINCCPQVNTTPAVDFTLLPKSRNIRVRRALHLLDDEDIAKLSRAFQLMRELPDDDPRSFTQQGNVHCAYCRGAHAHVGFPEKLLDIHGTWFLFAWHRMYLYFYERILGKLIDDPTFALPYWNWDSPEGMHMPEPFADENSALYEEQELKNDNLVAIYRQVVSAGATAELFHGKPYYPGDEPRPGAGSFEMVPHATVHGWVGDRHQPKHAFMGTADLSARDPLFFVHHSNVDRIWTIWKTLNRTDFTDLDWLNSEFMFYDEESRLVKIKVRDCLDLEKLGITYEDASLAPAWVKAQPTPRSDKKKKKKKISTVNHIMFPIKLDKVIRLVVPRHLTRPETSISNNVEALVIEGIKVDGNDKTVKFDVIINDGGNEDGIGPANTEFAGSYLSEPRSYNDKREKRVDRLRLGGISELLEGLGAQHDESVVVTLVPRYDPRVGTSVTIGGVKFDFA